MKQRFLHTLAASTVILANASFAETDPAYYNDYYCTTCHGTDGRGSEGVQAPRLAGMEPWYLKRQLENFRSGIRGTHPDDFQGSEMQPTAVSLTDASINELIDWITGWEYVPAPATMAGDVTAGKAHYAICATCHGAGGEGNPALGAPALAGQNDWYLATQLKNFKAGYRGRHQNDMYGAQMVPMADGLPNEQAITDVVAYINTLAGPRGSAGAIAETKPATAIERFNEGRNFYSVISIPPGAETLYLSGAGAKPKADGSWGTMEEQTIDIFDSYKATLEGMGWSLEDIVQVRVFAVADDNGELDFAGFNAGYQKFFGSDINAMKPVRSFVQVAGLVVDGWLAEVEIRATRIPE